MGIKPLLFKYPLDLTGKSPTNLVINEPHTIGSTKERAFVPNCGPFYTDSVVVTRADTGEVLRPVDQYLLLQPYQEASIRTGLDVCSVVYVTDQTVGDEVLITYQVVGGEFSWSVYALQEMLEALDLDERPVHWGDIIGKPALYPPTPHLHDLGDTYGWEYIGEQLEYIRVAILQGDAASHDELRQQFQYLIDQVQAQIDGFQSQLNQHVNDTSNPHQVTAAQVGLGLVQNFGIATNAEAQAATVNNKYMTPYLTGLTATAIANSVLSPHLSDFNNPHKVTKAQVNLGNVDNFATATTADAQAGTATDKFMTPALTKTAITQLVGNQLTAHLQDMNNPHQTTKAQVGLGNVDNFLTATQAEAQAGTANDRFMTPLRTAQAIAQLVGNSLTSHINNTNNPHNVTKAQVGLGNIPNAITRLRNQNSDAILLTAGGMYDHVNSGDHDARYTPKNTVGVDGSVYVTGGVAYVAVSGGWRAFWPPQWQ